MARVAARLPSSPQAGICGSAACCAERLSLSVQQAVKNKLFSCPRGKPEAFRTAGGQAALACMGFRTDSLVVQLPLEAGSLGAGGLGLTNENPRNHPKTRIPPAPEP